MNKRNLLRRRVSYHVCQEKEPTATTVHRLLSGQLRPQERPIPATTDRGRPRQTANSQILHQAGHPGCLPQHQNQGRRWIENNLHHEIRHLPILGHACWANQRTGRVSKMDQQDPTVIYWYMLHGISGRCPHILEQFGITPKRCRSHYLSYT